MEKGGAAKLSRRRKKIWMPAEDRRRVGGEGDVDFVTQAQDEAVGGEQPGPEQQGAFLAGPEGGKFVGGMEGAVGVVEDVGDGEVVGEGGPDEREGGAGDGDEAGDAGAAGGFAKTLGGNGELAAGLEGPQGDAHRRRACRRTAQARE